jgi:hypothetical protein
MEHRVAFTRRWLLDAEIDVITIVYAMGGGGVEPSRQLRTIPGKIFYYASGSGGQPKTQEDVPFGAENATRNGKGEVEVAV